MHKLVRALCSCFEPSCRFPISLLSLPLKKTVFMSMCTFFTSLLFMSCFGNTVILKTIYMVVSS
uniref:Uncharacterized protein n=1 Tax=Arundo donax TaxID=35708 RepID=A0A0A9C5P2_ARUDO